MNLKTLFRLLSQGFRSGDARQLEEEASRIEKEEAKKNGAKDAALSGFKRVGHFDDGLGISRWLREEGHGVQIDKPEELEVWQRGENFRLAVRQGEQWEVYIIIPHLASYQLRRKLV